MSAGKDPLRVAIIGTGRRADYYHGPLLRLLSDEVELVSIWGRSNDSAKKLGNSLNVPWYTNLDKLIKETKPIIGIVCVGGGPPLHRANGPIGIMAVEHGLHVLLETPIAHKLSDADEIIRIADKKGLKIEVAEQFYRRPLEQIKLKLIATGLFGRIYSSFNDFEGHDYHGVSVMRSYFGFDTKPIKVTGFVRDYDLGDQCAQAFLSNEISKYGTRTETQEHGIIEFSDGKLGIHHWSNVSYNSPIRWWRSSRFLGEKGMGISIKNGDVKEEILTLLTSSGESLRPITIKRYLERLDGGGLQSIVAYTGDSEYPIVKWENPFRSKKPGHGLPLDDDAIGVASCIMSLVEAVRNNKEPEYGPHQARLDQEITIAIRQSSLQGGKPITLPFDPQAQTV